MSEGQLSVALLLSDIGEVKEISAVFRKLGIIPHFYEDLKTFWSGTLENIPSLSIIDVKLMSEGDLVLHNHPHVVAEKMPLVFYYTQNTEPLILSTQDFFHLGLLKKSEHYDLAMKTILKRLNQFIKLENDNYQLTLEKKKQQAEIEKLQLENLTIIQTDQYQSMVKSVCLQLEEWRDEGDFFRALEKVIQGVDEIVEFSMMELSFNGQKLISPIAHVQKFRAIPSLWLGQACPKGIELFAQNMATQVAIDIMGGDLVSLLIKGNHSKPEKIMFIKTKNELFFNQFDWNMFEAYLNGFYSSFKNKLEREPTNERKFTSSFQALSFLDQYLFGSSLPAADNSKGLNKLDYRLIDLDLSGLVDIILKKGNNRFFWNKFEVEFINRLEIQSRIEFRVFDFGVMHLGFLVKSNDLDLFFDELKEFSAKFSYWKYFEESEGVLSHIVHPKVNMVAMSAFAYLKHNQISTQHVNDKTSDKETLAKMKTRELIWGKESNYEV